VCDYGNDAIRRVTMSGAVSTVAGNGEAWFADGSCAAGRFNSPSGIVVDEEGIVLIPQTQRWSAGGITPDKRWW
jgi:hypothetical protein